jgi:hypothetical protein
MLWLIVLRDHFMHPTYLVPLLPKESKYMAHELCHIFGLIGYAIIYQSENGNEESSKEILDLLYELDPKIHTVQGRLHKPKNDQGSVECTNQMIKKVIAKIVDSRKAEYPGQQHSWISVYPLAMSSINSSQCSQGSNISPYELTFGMPFDEPLYKESLKSLCQCKSIAERNELCGAAFKSQMIMTLICQAVLNRMFIESQYQTVSLSAAYKKSVRHNLVSQYSCKFKKQCKKGSCGCMKSGCHCTSSCLCNGCKESETQTQP